MVPISGLYWQSGNLAFIIFKFKGPVRHIWLKLSLTR